MSKTLRTSERPGLLIPSVDEVPIISDVERAAMRGSLEKAASDIASGDYDVVTPQSLRSEFEAIYFDGAETHEL